MSGEYKNSQWVSQLKTLAVADFGRACGLIRGVVE